MRNYRSVRRERQTALRDGSSPRRRPRIVLADEAAGWATAYFQSVIRPRFWALARSYWFDALLAVAGVVGVVEVVLTQDVKDGPRGPLWFDVLAVLGMTLPLFARRRFPFGAPIASGVVFAGSSFVDGRLTPHGVVPFLTALAVFVLFGLIRDQTQAIAGLAFGIGVTAIIFHNDPGGSDAGGFVFTSVVFTVAWAIGFGLSRKFHEAEEAKQRLGRAEQEPVERARLAGRAAAPPTPARARRARGRAHAHRARAARCRRPQRQREDGPCVGRPPAPPSSSREGTRS